MFDPNPLNNIPSEIKDMYEKAFRAASDGAMDAFKDLPRTMQRALDAEGIKEFLNAWDDLPSKVKDAQRAMDQKARKLKELIDLAEKLNEEFKEQVQLEQDILAEERDRASTLQEFIQRQATLDRHIHRSNQRIQQGVNFTNAMKSSYMGVTNAQNALNNAQSKFTNGQKMNAFLAGAFGNKMRALSGTFKALTGGGLAMFTAFGKAFGFVLRMSDEAYQKSRNFGYGFSQSLSNVAVSFGDFFDNLMQGRITNLAQNVEVRNLFTRSLGTRNVNEDVTLMTDKMVRQYRMGTQEAVRASSMMYRMNRFNAKATSEDFRRVEAIAEKNGISTSELMRDIAQNGNLYAQYAEKGTASFVRAAIEARKIGVSLQSMEGFADRMVNDFESSLMMQAKLQTVMPGMDMSELMYASQFGSSEDIQAALKSTFGAVGISKMPRSLQNMVSQATGLSKEELLNLDRGVAPDAGVTKDALASEKTNSVVTNFIESIDMSVPALVSLAGAATAAAASLAWKFGGALGKIGARALPGIMAVGGGLMAGYTQYNTSRGDGKSSTQSLVDGGLVGGGTALGGLAGAVAGGKLGAAIGSIIPGAGTIGGGLLGAALGGIFGTLAGGSLGTLLMRKRAEVKHSGGIVGKGGTTRLVNSTVFHNAPRFHSGLMPDEVPSILQRGEAVLSRSQLAGLTRLTTVAQSLGGIGAKVPQQTIAEANPMALDADSMYLNRTSVQYVSSGVGGRNVSTVSASSATNSNSRIEALLEQLIQVSREGKTIHLDGKKVGTSLVNAFSRE